MPASPGCATVFYKGISPMKKGGFEIVLANEKVIKQLAVFENI
jgi:hypothetical protein